MVIVNNLKNAKNFMNLWILKVIVNFVMKNAKLVLMNLVKDA